MIADELLEIVDRFRIPLAEKQYNGEELSNQETSDLILLDDMVVMILLNNQEMPSESDEVKYAMEVALGAKL